MPGLRTFLLAAGLVALALVPPLAQLLYLRLRRSPTAAAFLDGVTVASMALMVDVTLQLGRAALCDIWTILLAVVALALLLRARLNATWLIAGGAAAGWLIQTIGAA